ncbi:MAG: ATP-binding protein [Nitrospirota bacterium]
MGIYKHSDELLAILKHGIEELITLDTEEKVLSSSLKLCMAISETTSGHIIKQAGENIWEIDGAHKNIYIPSELIAKLTQEGTFSINDEIAGILPLVELQGKINTIIPINVDGTIIAAFLINNAGNNSPLVFSLLSLYISSLLSKLNILREVKEMKTHYEDLLIKKETAERLASLGYVAAGLAHEIKNPLVSIKTLAQLLPERFDDAEFREQFTSIAISEIDRIVCIVSDLLNFAKSSEPEFAQVDIRKLIDEVILLLSVRTDESGIVVVKKFPEHIPSVYGDKAQLKQVLLNLLLNSLEAAQKGGAITVSLTTGDDGLGVESIIIKITDTGTGIESENLIHIFEPFFTTKGKGTGLGLSICKRIVSRHGGNIFVDSVHKQGTTVTVELPVKNTI